MSGISPQRNTRKDSCIILSDRECTALGSGTKKQAIFLSSLKCQSAENVFVHRPLTRKKRREFGLWHHRNKVINIVVLLN